MPAAGRVGDASTTSHDAHECPSCPHTATGPATSGSPDVLINDRAALRVGDRGAHGACCGPNEWEAVEGATSVLVNDRPVHRAGDTTMHCGGNGELVAGSPNVIIGDRSGPPAPPAERHQFHLELVGPDGKEPVRSRRVVLTSSRGTTYHLKTDRKGMISLRSIEPQELEVYLDDDFVK